jgi:hypothetical protein
LAACDLQTAIVRVFGDFRQKNVDRFITGQKKCRLSLKELGIYAIRWRKSPRDRNRVCQFSAGVFLELSRLLAYITDDGVSSREKQGGLHDGQTG